jgi:hypothetical protein
MKGYKRYNPASFKKKVDVETDTYLPKKGTGKTLICPGCHAILSLKRWRLDEPAYAKLLHAGIARQAWCPACQKIRDGYPSGQVTLTGPFLAEHRDEILRLIANEEKRAREKNPLERIMSLSQGQEQLVLTTTDEKLAQRIGRELHKACGGTVTYNWSHNNKFVRVQWER